MQQRAYRHLCYGLFVAPLLGLANVAKADSDLYVGASVGSVSTSGYTRLSIDPRDLENALEGTAFKIVGGLRPFRPVSFEVSYVDFGRSRLGIVVFGPAGGVFGPVTPTLVSPTGTLEAHAVSVSALGLLPISPSVDLFGRMGLARWQSTTSNVFPPSENRRQAGTDAAYGIGAQVNLSKVALRVEYEAFKIASDTNKLFSVGFTYGFH